MPDSRDDGFDEQREAARRVAREQADELREAARRFVRERPPAPLILDLANPWPPEPPRKVVMSRYADVASRIIYGAINIGVVP